MVGPVLLGLPIHARHEIMRTRREDLLELFIPFYTHSHSCRGCIVNKPIYTFPGCISGTLAGLDPGVRTFH